MASRVEIEEVFMPEASESWSSLKFYEDLYLKTLEDKSQTQNQVTLSLALISVVSGALIFYFNNLPQFEFKWVPVIFIFLFIIASLSLSISVICLLMIFLGEKYKQLPAPNEIKKYQNKLFVYYKKVGGRGIKKRVESDMVKFLEDVYVKSATFNDLKNISISKWIVRTKQFIAISVVFSILGFPFYSACKPNPKAQQVEIANWGGLVNAQKK